MGYAYNCNTSVYARKRIRIYYSVHRRLHDDCIPPRTYILHVSFAFIYFFEIWNEGQMGAWIFTSVRVYTILNRLSTYYYIMINYIHTTYMTYALHIHEGLSKKAEFEGNLRYSTGGPTDPP